MKVTQDKSRLLPVRVKEDPVNVAASPSDYKSIEGLSRQAAEVLGRRQAWLDLQSTLPLIIIDVLASAFAVTVSTTAHGWSGGSVQPAFAIGIVLLTILLHRLNGLYPACGLSYSLEFRGILQTSIVISACSAFGLAMQTQGADFPWLCWLLLSLMIFLCLSAARPIGRRILCRFDWWAQPVVVIGDSEHGRQLVQRLDLSRHEGIRPLGIIYDPRSHWTQSVGQEARESNPVSRQQQGASHLAKEQVTVSRVQLLGPLADIEEVLLATGACRVAVAERASDQWQDFHQFRGIPHVMIPLKMAQQPTERVRMAEREGGIDLHCYTALTSPHALLAKRLMDLTLIMLASPLWIPLALLIAIAIKIGDPGPVFYRQSRVGRYRQPFKAIKFRSMVNHADQRLKEYLEAHPELQAEWKLTHKLRKDPRVTKLGQFLRKTSLDELPQLWNVLVGEMSLVGPRPIIDSGDYDREYIQEYPEVFELYQMVRPGITGLWQVSGRNMTSYDQRVFYDRFYLQNWSLTLDIFILWRTIKTALLREGAC